MKKFLTGLACFAMVLVGGLSLAACCGNDNIVDTSGNYANATFAEVQEALVNVEPTQEIEAYEFRMAGNVDIDGAKANLNYHGKIDQNGNAGFDIDFNMNASNDNINLNINYNGELYLNATDGYYYLNNNGKKTKAQSFGMASDLFETYGSILNFDAVYTQFLTEEDPSSTYQISTTGGQTKIHLTQTSDDGTENIVTGDIYVIFDGEGKFVGFHMTANIFGGNIVLEFLSTTGAVEFPTDLDSYKDAQGIEIGF